MNKNKGLVYEGIKLTREEMLANIPDDAPVRFHIGLERGTLKVELYVPKKDDHQEPHDQDECYIITRGSGKFQVGSKTVEFKAGDFLFTPAGIDHRFLDFGEEMEAWVIFYGPRGGEC